MGEFVPLRKRNEKRLSPKLGGGYKAPVSHTKSNAWSTYTSKKLGASADDSEKPVAGYGILTKMLDPHTFEVKMRDGTLLEAKLKGSCPNIGYAVPGKTVMYIKSGLIRSILSPFEAELYNI